MDDKVKDLIDCEFYGEHYNQRWCNDERVNCLFKQNLALKEKLKVAIEALKFYSNTDNNLIFYEDVNYDKWVSLNNKKNFDYIQQEYDFSMYYENGTKAQQALTQIEEEE